MKSPFITKAFSTLSAIAKKLPEKPAHGIGGMWTPDEQRESEPLIWRTHDAGYSHQLVSIPFEFVMWETYTYAEGSVVELTRGTEANVQRCLDFFAQTD